MNRMYKDPYSDADLSENGDDYPSLDDTFVDEDEAGLKDFELPDDDDDADEDDSDNSPEDQHN